MTDYTFDGCSLAAALTGFYSSSQSVGVTQTRYVCTHAMLHMYMYAYANIARQHVIQHMLEHVRWL